ncbi:hypothetical protein [Brachybacterium sp. UMB0905]|uniref:hypothetical protein n=1 Tax=Brachybacterium sp. UMB0905 TaxID=2069310 RepID=UPI000C80C4BE|nr:hypothetical protein [Brachybacterium sp. UMB0905]PMC75536.1 hypothetical protein CJ197_07240 [Brachybacterium sp. UMB0905]
MNRDLTPEQLREALTNPDQQGDPITRDLTEALTAPDATTREAAARRAASWDGHPWRAHWEPHERLEYRGREAHLAGLYETRLGESRAEADAHVHRELSAAWTRGHLPAVAERLRTETARVEALPALQARETVTSYTR